MKVKEYEPVSLWCVPSILLFEILIIPAIYHHLPD